jgi:hypothetical protein
MKKKILKFANKQFRVCDFENEFTLRQGKYGTILFTKFLDSMRNLDGVNFDFSNLNEAVVGIQAIGNNFDVELYSQILAVCTFEMFENEWQFIDENLEYNTMLIFKNLKASDLEILKETAQSFFTFIPQFTRDAFQMHSAGLVQILKQTPTS